jgi:hypothetical protein
MAKQLHAEVGMVEPRQTRDTNTREALLRVTFDLI